jgi:uncharacterized protein YjbJ (UPF0337 family)
MDANLYWYHDQENFSNQPQARSAVAVRFSTLPESVETDSSVTSLSGCVRAALRREGETHPMNWDRIEGNWKQMKGKAREQWGKLTDSDFDQIAGKKDQLVGRIQERYGISKDEAQKQADAWARTQSEEQVREPHEPSVRR